jgi:hypothetical protein
MYKRIFHLAFIQFSLAGILSTRPTEIIDLVAVDVVATVQGAANPRSILTLREVTDLCGQLGARNSSPRVKCCERHYDGDLDICSPLDVARKFLFEARSGFMFSFITDLSANAPVTSHCSGTVACAIPVVGQVL